MLYPSSAVEGIFLNPVEAALDQHELIAVYQLQLHMNLVAIHVAIENQLILRDTLEGEAGFPVLVTVFGERESLVVRVDRGAVTGERIVHPLERHSLRKVKDG